MELSVKMRIAIVISVLWLLGWLAFAIEAWHQGEGTTIFIVFGIIPIMTFWGIIWIKQGLKKDQQTRKTLIQRLRNSV
jgi:hypothetical protein